MRHPPRIMCAWADPTPSRSGFTISQIGEIMAHAQRLPDQARSRLHYIRHIFSGTRMAITMFDQMLFPLGCGHDVVLGRLVGRKEWTCAECGQKNDLTDQPIKAALAKDIDMAEQIDAR
jgi:hypothetical protein